MSSDTHPFGRSGVHWLAAGKDLPVYRTASSVFWFLKLYIGFCMELFSYH
jgi:hypothetical protein